MSIQKCGFRGCEKPAEYYLGYVCYDEHGEIIDSDSEYESIESCADHLVDLALINFQDLGYPGEITSFRGPKDYPGLLERVLADLKKRLLERH